VQCNGILFLANTEQKSILKCRKFYKLVSNLMQSEKIPSVISFHVKNDENIHTQKGNES
jgi:hypothetical protein